MYVFSIKSKLNLSLVFFPGNPGGRGGVLSWKSRQEEGLVLQEIQVRGGLKSDPIRRGGADFFWNNPMPRRYTREECFFGIWLSILGQRPSGTTSIHSLVASVETTWLQCGHFMLSSKQVCSTSLRLAQYATISYPETVTYFCCAR